MCICLLLFVALAVLNLHILIFCVFESTYFRMSVYLIYTLCHHPHSNRGVSLLWSLHLELTQLPMLWGNTTREHKTLLNLDRESMLTASGCKANLPKSCCLSLMALCLLCTKSSPDSVWWVRTVGEEWKCRSQQAR